MEDKPASGRASRQSEPVPRAATVGRTLWLWGRWLWRQPLVIVALVLVAIAGAFYLVDLLELLPRR